MKQDQGIARWVMGGCLLLALGIGSSAPGASRGDPGVSQEDEQRVEIELLADGSVMFEGESHASGDAVRALLEGLAVGHPRDEQKLSVIELAVRAREDVSFVHAQGLMAHAGRAKVLIYKLAFAIENAEKDEVVIGSYRLPTGVGSTEWSDLPYTDPPLYTVKFPARPSKPVARLRDSAGAIRLEGSLEELDEALGAVRKAHPTAVFQLMVGGAYPGRKVEDPPPITMGHFARLLSVLEGHGVDLTRPWELPPWAWETGEVEPEAPTEPFSSPTSFEDVLGIGGGATFRSRLAAHSKKNAPGRAGTERPLRDALEWLRKHQDEDGKWDADGFMNHDPDDDRSSGPGKANHDIGITGLALLAFLGDGHTHLQGDHKEVVANGLAWLRRQQNLDSGLLGEATGSEFLYNHALASLALAEAYEFTRSPLLKRTVELAVRYIERARNPHAVWRYDVPPVGDNDTSITGWMVFALLTARDAGIEVDAAAFDSALHWFDAVTDPATGRCGYDTWGSMSSRVPDNAHYPREKGEAMTAEALLCRFFLGQQPAETEVMNKHADLLLRAPPAWDVEGRGCDMYYWYHGTYAMYQMGGEHWTVWNRAMKAAVAKHQRRDGAARGSWDPVGPWGHIGGRIYSTALMALCLEVYFRYERLTEEK